MTETHALDAYYFSTEINLPMNNISTSKLSTIFASEELTATLLDGSSTAVRVRAVPVRHLGRVLQLADQEAELLDYVCQIPEAGSAEPAASASWKQVEPGWTDALTDESHIQLYEAAKRLNFTRATIWAERQIAAKKMNNELMLKTQEILLPLMKQLASSLGLSPATSPAAGSVTTKS